MQTSTDNSTPSLPGTGILSKKLETPQANKNRNNNHLRNATTQFFVDLLVSKCFKAIVKTLLWGFTLSFIVLIIILIVSIWLDVALSLGLYLADKNSGPFKDLFLTFS